MANVSFAPVTQPPPACYPSDVNGLLTLIATQGLTGTIPDTAGGGIYVGSTPPSSSLTNKVWFVVDGSGRPLGVKLFYNGNWRPLYSGAPGDIKMTLVTPNDFDGTGRGIVGSWHDGWAICNGNNGTPDLCGSPAHHFATAGWWNGSQWVIWDPTTGSYSVTGGTGEYGHSLSPSELPRLQVFGYGERIGQGGGSQVISMDYKGNAPQQVSWPVVDAGGTEVGSPQTTLPLPGYYVFGFLMFVGYA